MNKNTETEQVVVEMNECNFSTDDDNENDVYLEPVEQESEKQIVASKKQIMASEETEFGKSPMLQIFQEMTDVAHAMVAKNPEVVNAVRELGRTFSKLSEAALISACYNFGKNIAVKNLPKRILVSVTGQARSLCPSHMNCRCIPAQFPELKY